MFRLTTLCVISGLLLAASASYAAAQAPDSALREFPKGDFSISAVDWSEVRSGGVARDRIPAIDRPQTIPIAKAAQDLEPTEPVVGLVINGEARAYPLRVLIWHEIANDELGGVPVAVTYCPLCNTSVVFDRRHEDRVLDFGTTGRLRNSDLIMYDRQTETWWQQFLGQAIIGTLTGAELRMVPARLESFKNFAERAPDGTVLVGDAARPYGRNPYENYDSSSRPFLSAAGSRRARSPDRISARRAGLVHRAWSNSWKKSRARAGLRCNRWDGQADKPRPTWTVKRLP